MVIYDIETYLSDDAHKIFEKRVYRPDPKLSPLDKPPGDITKLKDEAKRSERLAAWQDAQVIKLAESVEKKKQDDIDRAALHWTTGKVVSICAAGMGESDPFFKRCDLENEAELLTSFVEYLEAMSPQNLIGKSNTIFDDGFLVGRLMVNNIKIPFKLRQKHPHDITDINQIFGWGNKHPQHAKLKDMAIALSLGDKLAEGGDVKGMVLAEKRDDILAYNWQDVVITKSVFTRYCNLCQG